MVEGGGHDRAADADVRVVDAFDGGFGWLANPTESLERCSHALETDAGLWLLDPLDAPGLDAVLAEHATDAGDALESASGSTAVEQTRGGSPVAGVAVCAGWHARDAARIAARHDVPVTVPSWMDRPLDRLEPPSANDDSTEGTEIPVQRVDDSLPGTSVALHPVSPMGLWREAICWRERDRTLYVPESLGTAETFRVGAERVGVSIYARLAPPRDEIAAFDPERVLFGHGTGVFTDPATDPATALADALANARRRFPRALLAHGPRAALNLLGAIRR